MKPAMCARVIVPAFCLAVGTVCLVAQTGPTRRVLAAHTVVELIADRQADASTKEMWMGLRFELEQGWHVYWRNPGDSGGPATVLWHPVYGATTSEFEWPLPERIPLGPLINYGYTNEVVLPFAVRLTRPLGAGSATLVGDFEWMICREVCIPDKRQLSIVLPLAAENASRVATWRRQIEEARQRVPRRAPATWRPSASATSRGFDLTVQLAKPAASATFLPFDLGVIDLAAEQTATASGHQLVLHLTKAKDLASLPRSLKGVLALPSGEAFEVDARLSASPAAKRPAAPRKQP
jgi:thiol:disulfide interchange protein DsbD